MTQFWKIMDSQLRKNRVTEHELFSSLVEVNCLKMKPQMAKA